MGDVIEIKRKLSIADVIVTHIEEDWGKSYDDYIALENEYPNVKKRCLFSARTGSCFPRY